MRETIKLSELEAHFERIVEPGKRYEEVDKLEDAQGVMFLCPKCFETNNGRVGTHSVLCWFKGRGVSDDEDPKPGRWAFAGNSIDDLTLVPSINLPGEKGCQWHGFIRNGVAIL